MILQAERFYIKEKKLGKLSINSIFHYVLDAVRYLEKVQVVIWNSLKNVMIILLDIIHLPVEPSPPLPRVVSSTESTIFILKGDKSGIQICKSLL